MASGKARITVDPLPTMAGRIRVTVQGSNAPDGTQRLNLTRDEVADLIAQLTHAMRGGKVYG